MHTKRYRSKLENDLPFVLVVRHMDWVTVLVAILFTGCLSTAAAAVIEVVLASALFLLSARVPTGAVRFSDNFSCKFFTSRVIFTGLIGTVLGPRGTGAVDNNPSHPLRISASTAGGQVIASLHRTAP